MSLKSSKKDQQGSTKHYKENWRSRNTNPTKSWSELMCFARVSISCFTCGTCCGAHPLPHQTSSPVFLPVLVELMLLMLTHVFMSSCFKFRVACPVQFALWGVQVLIKAATLYQRYHDRNHKLLHIGSTEIYIYSICRCWWNVATYKWKVHNVKIEIIFFVVKLPSLFIAEKKPNQPI
jgi:hypothetical protein